MKLSGIEDELTESIIEYLYEAREEKLSILTKLDKSNMKDLINTRKIGYEEILKVIEELPECNKEAIKEKIDEQIENINYINSYNNQKFYKCGVIDGVNLIIESICGKYAIDNA